MNNIDWILVLICIVDGYLIRKKNKRIVELENQMCELELRQQDLYNCNRDLEIKLSGAIETLQSISILGNMFDEPASAKVAAECLTKLNGEELDTDGYKNLADLPNNTIYVSPNDYDKIVKELENPTPPNDKLKDAAKKFKERYE